MPVKARLRGFGPLVPEDVQVTFYDDLPSDTLCAQCDNVSALLFRDPGDHGYCSSCVKMCTSGSQFLCFVCGTAYRFSQLRQDASTAEKIAATRIICPRAVEGRGESIQFNELKDHLKWCNCGQMCRTAEGFRQPSSVPMTSCCICHEKVPKKEILEHVKICKEQHKERHQQRIHQTMSRQLENYRTETLNETAQLKAEIAKLYQLWSESHSRIIVQEKEVAKLEAALGQKDNDIVELTQKLQSNQAEIAKLQQALSQKNDNDLLTERVNSHGIDMRNIQSQCEKAEQSISDMQDKYSTLQESVSRIDADSKHRIDKIEEIFRNMKACFMEAYGELKRSKQEMEQCYLEVGQIGAAQKNMKDVFEAEVNGLRMECKHSTEKVEQYCHQELRQLRAVCAKLKHSHENLQACFDHFIMLHTSPAPPGLQQSVWSDYRRQ